MIKQIQNKAISTYFKVMTAIENKKAETYIDFGVKMMIGIVVGALLLSAVVVLFKTNIIPEVTTKIAAMFNTATT